MQHDLVDDQPQPQHVEEETPYPVDITLEQVRASVVGRDEFRETVKDDTIVMNYDYCFGATFPDPNTAPDPETRQLWRIRRECRGLIFDKETGRLLARRLHKFFNLNQDHETDASRIDWSRPFTIVEKRDGRMVSPYRCSSGDIVWASKNGHTSLSDDLRDDFLPKCTSRGQRYDAFARHWIDRGYTPTFEWCDADRPVVINYDASTLDLVALRCIRTGVYVSHNDMRASAEEFNVCVVREWNNTATAEEAHTASSASSSSASSQVDALVEAVKATKGVEGCVIKFDAGDWYKVKSEWYFAQSKSHLALPTNERLMWASVLSNNMDDILPVLSAEVREQVETFQRRVMQGLRTYAVMVYEKALDLFCRSVNGDCDDGDDGDETTTSASTKAPIDKGEWVKRVQTCPNVSRSHASLYYTLYPQLCCVVDEPRVCPTHTTDLSAPQQELFTTAFANVRASMLKNCKAKTFEGTRAAFGVEQINFFV